MFRKNYKFNNLNDSLMPVLVLNLIFGHQIMPHTMGGCKFIQTVFYFVLVIIIYGVSMGYSTVTIVTAEWFKYSESVYFAALGANILIMPVNFILGWVHRNELLLINIKSLNVDKKLVKMGVILHDKKACNFATKIVIYWLFCYVTINSVAMLWTMKAMSWQMNFLTVYSLQNPLHVNFLVDLLFCSLIRNMEIRFKKINEQLIKLEYNSHVTNIRVDDNKPVYILQLSKEIHLELEQLCGKITRIFGLQIITSMASLFFLLTTMTYNLYVTLLARDVPDWASRIFILTCWIVIQCSKLLFINHICSRTVNEWKKTGVIIHQLESRFANAEICKWIQQLSIQMIQNPLQIYPLGFIQLGHSFLQEFFGTLATYLIISIQMAPID
ncbi:GSCOCT00014044001.2-RA-CDS [Cotesia congregata]|uniref:Gustatory receptor n=1 Tax=Cotesia congregata TaxID=51543 RepID=A0A8J2HHZ4_COTCN|nr:GSCOCT00014044001.2-RA-CDS [Cotesia congregata]CAG5101810.1 gustatory receptor 27 [Cotesia congregata]